MKPTTMYACVWLAVALAISVGIYITKDASCLWAFVIPAWLSYHNEYTYDDESEK